MQKTAQKSLRRCFGLRESITITVGTVIGVGLFTVGANAVGVLGPAVLPATLAALGVSIYPALLYAEMGGALPLAGGTYQYAALGLCRPLGVLAGLCFVLSMVSVAGGEALAFSFYVRTLLETLGLPLPVDDRVLAAGAILAFVLLGLLGVQMTGRMQNGFMFFFWGVAALWLGTMLPSLRPGLLAQAPPAGLTPAAFVGCVALIWWCFAGFETCCAMGEEIKYPQLNLPRALFLAPFIVFAVNGLFQWVLVCIVPGGALPALAEAQAPYAQGMRIAGVTGLPLLLLCAGIAFGGDFSTLNASVTAPARYLYTMARDGAFPAVFARLHPRFGTPYIGVLSLGALTLALVATDSVRYIASLSLFATLLYYIVGMAAAWGLRKKHPEIERPYRAPLIWLGVPVSILLYLGLMTQLEKGAVAAGALWCALGLGAYLLWGKRRGIRAPAVPPLPPPPDASQRRRLDKEYRRWRAVVAAAVVGVLALYLVPMLAG